MPVDRFLLDLAGGGLPGVAPPAPVGWEQRLDDVFGHGLAGFLAAAVAAGHVELDQSSARRLTRRLESEAIRAVRLEGELLRLAPALARLPAVVVKGPVLAHAAYPDPALRPFTDLDVVVADVRQRDAVGMLETLGYRRSRPEPAPGYDAHVGKALALVHPGGVLVDLHRTLVAGRAGTTIDVGELLAGRRLFAIGPANVPAPAWEAHLVEVALHAVVGDGLHRALSIRDVAQLAFHPELDAPRFVDLVHRWEVVEPVGQALAAAREAWSLDLPRPLAALAAVGHASAERPAGAAAVRSARSRIDDVRHGGLRRRMALTRALVLPSRSFLEWSYGERSTATLYRERWRALSRRAGDAQAPDPPVARLRSRQEAWSAARPPRTVRANGRTGAGGGPDPATGARPAPTPEDDPRPSLAVGPESPSATGPLIGGIAVLAVTALFARLGVTASGVVLIPSAGLLFAWATARHLQRRRPDEAWVGRWLLLGVCAKVAASYARYLTLVIGYEGIGDASAYDRFGRQLARAWMGNGVAPDLPDLRQTNFLKWFTGVVYYLFGTNMIAGFFVFGLLALAGSYLWYRATADAVPFIDKRLYLALVLFAPSIAFWPSSIGKEALMQLGIGAAALATAYFLRQLLLPGLLVGGAGGWLLWIVRPHLLAMVTMAAGFAYLVGRVRPKGKTSGSIVTRTLGLLVIAFLVVFTIAQGAQFLGLKDLSLSSVENKLEQQSEHNTEGGSSFDSGGDYLSPKNLPRGVVTVLLRPFPWETGSPFQLLASLESVLIAGLIVMRLPALKNALVRARGTPFLLYCWLLTILYAATFASFSNFGLLVRQRSLVLPALFVLVSVQLHIDATDDSRAPPEVEVVRGGSP